MSRGALQSIKLLKLKLKLNTRLKTKNNYYHYIMYHKILMKFLLYYNDQSNSY